MSLGWVHLERIRGNNSTQLLLFCNIFADLPKKKEVSKSSRDKLSAPNNKKWNL